MYEVAEEGGFVRVSISLLNGGIGLGSGSGVILSVATDGNVTGSSTATG